MTISDGTMSSLTDALPGNGVLAALALGGVVVLALAAGAWALASVGTQSNAASTIEGETNRRTITVALLKKPGTTAMSTSL